MNECKNKCTNLFKCENVEFKFAIKVVVLVCELK